MPDEIYIDKLSLIIILCVSFYITFFSAALSRFDSIIRYEGLAFFVPLLLSSSALIFWNEAQVKPFLYMSDILPALNIVLYGLFRYQIKKQGNKTAKASKRWLSCGLLLTLAAELMLHLQINGQAAFFHLALSASIVCYLMHFQINISSSLTEKIIETEKQNKILEKQLNYEVRKRTLEIEMAHERLVSISKSDSLTGIYNKKAILFEIEKSIFTKPNSQLTILLFDIDNFKKINDTYGHLEGDNCILRVVDIARSCLRENEKIGRYGGDEFIVFLPNTNLQQGINIAERIRKKVMEADGTNFTISIGVAAYPEDGPKVNDLIAVADKGLYKSKHLGRNYVSHARFF